MKHKVSMQDIADQLNITKVSVSKALNNKPGVSESLRSRILGLAEEMGYRSPRSAVTKKTFAFLMQKRFFLETYKFYNVIFFHLNKLCANANCQLIPVVIEAEETNIQMPENADGIFLLGECPDSYLKSISMSMSLAAPIVAVDFYKNYLDVNYVLVDNFYLGYCATLYLIDKGHRDIGFVGNINQTSSINDRYFGYLKALQNTGLIYREKYVFANDDCSIYKLDVNLPDPLPTAFVCHCDMAAYFMMNSLKNINKSIPEDVSLISFDNTDLSLSTTPQLTSMDIDTKEIAETAFSVMEQILQGKESYHRYYVSTRLIERDSVKAIEKLY